MAYSVNDPDVDTYLKSLNTQSITIDTDTDTGAENLKKIIIVIEKDLKELRYAEAEKLNQLTQRKLIVTKMIESLGDNLYNTDSLETRYLEYKKDVQAVTASVDSMYMKVIQKTIDTFLSSGIKQLYSFRRELNILTYLVATMTEEIVYLKDLEDSIVTLKTKIDNL